MEWVVLLLILVLVLAAAWYLYSADPVIKIKGSGESLSQIQQDVLDILEPNLKEYGTAQITDHLHKFYDYTKNQKNDLKNQMKKSDLNLKPSGLKYLALLIHDIADHHDIIDPHEFIENSGIAGFVFMRPALKAKVLSAVQPYNAQHLSSIKDLIKDLIREKNASADPDIILKQIEHIRMYTLHKKRLEPDHLALRPIILAMIGVKQQPQLSSKQDLDRLIEKIKLLQVLKDYPSIRLDRITTLRELLERLDPISYLEGKKDAERMFKSDRDRELERERDKLKQELKDKELAAALQAEEDKKMKQEEELQKQEAELQKQEEESQKQEEERLIREEFDKILDEDPALQQQIIDNEFTREQLYKQFKIQWVGGSEQPDRNKIIKIIKEILERKK
jgi:hypothetical protein